MLAILIAIGHFKRRSEFSLYTDLLPYMYSANVSGGIKINMFFIIAGFYSMLLIREKHTDGRTLPFCLNRLTRLLPCYYYVLLCTTLLYYFMGRWSFEMLPSLTYDQIKYLFHNVVLFHPDIWSFRELNFSIIPAYYVVYQSWSLAVDIAILMLAPWFLHTNRRFAILACFSVVYASYYFYHGAFRNFLAPCLLFFVMGGLGYLWYHRYGREFYRQRWLVLAGYGAGFTLLFLACIFGYLLQRFPPMAVYYAYMALAAVLIPFMAACTRKQRFDRELGELAYPLYLNHIIILKAFRLIFDQTPGEITLLFICLGVSALMYIGIDRPIGYLRRRTFQPPPRAFI